MLIRHPLTKLALLSPKLALLSPNLALGYRPTYPGFVDSGRLGPSVVGDLPWVPARQPCGEFQHHVGCARGSQI